MTFPGGPRPNTLGSDHSTDIEAKYIACLCVLSACLFVAWCVSMICARIQVSCCVVVLLSRVSDVSRLSCVRLYLSFGRIAFISCPLTRRAPTASRSQVICFSYVWTLHKETSVLCACVRVRSVRLSVCLSVCLSVAVFGCL